MYLNNCIFHQKTFLKNDKKGELWHIVFFSLVDLCHIAFFSKTKSNLSSLFQVVAIKNNRKEQE